MAKPDHTTNNILRLADFTVKLDPVVAAQREMQAAGNDDAAYERARDRFANARPRTLAGVHAHVASVLETVRQVSDGDTLTADGWAQVIARLEGVECFTRQATARRTG